MPEDYQPAIRSVDDVPPDHKRGGDVRTMLSPRSGSRRRRPLPSRAPAMRRSAITGIGVVAPGGVTRDAFWEMITSGRTATRGITFFDPTGFRSQIAAEADFDPHAAGLTDQEIAR